MTVTEIGVIPGVAGVINESGLPDHMLGQGLHVLERELARWMDGVRAVAQRASMFDRTQYAVPDDPYDRMRIARAAVQGDYTVGSAAEITEALMLQGSKIESRDADEADILNQWWTGINGDQVLRKWHREEFTYSQAVIALWWGRKTFTVRGLSVPDDLPLEKHTDPATGVESLREPLDPKTHRPMKKPKGQRRRKKITLTVPTGITFLDPLKIVPVGNSIFGANQLAWHASRAEIGAYNRVTNGEILDPIMSTLFAGRYIPSALEIDQITQLCGVDVFRLILLDEKNVFRHTRTMPDYSRFPDVRLRTVFPLLDLKQQLLEADRVALIGAANYLLLVRKGTEKDPAEQAELDNLNNGMRVLAKLPVIVSDHRLEIQIIVPPQEHVLSDTKYDLLDHRIHDAVMGALTTQNATRTDTTLSTARSVGRVLESRRTMIKTAIELEIFQRILDHPENKDILQETPMLTFVPRNIQLDTEQQVIQAVMALRTQQEISRETILEFFNLDQEIEAQRREYEETSGLDDIFKTSVPFNSPLNQPPGAGMAPGGGPIAPQVSGASGGRPVGGGNTPNSPAKQARPRTSSGNATKPKGN